MMKFIKKCYSKLRTFFDKYKEDNYLPLEYNSDYENIRVTCPHCNRLVTFNRVSDLKMTGLITGKNVSCLYCQKEFEIVHDFINHNYEKIIFYCSQLKEKKQYMQIIINLCMSYEMFFYTILRIYLTIKPLKDLNEYERIQKNKILNKILEDKIEKFTFNKMLNEFIKLFINIESTPICNLEDSINYINKMNGEKLGNINKQIAKISNTKLKNQLIVLNALQESGLIINNLRNKVAHKYAYRPTQEQTNKEILIARSIIFSMTDILNVITDDVFRYKFDI